MATRLNETSLRRYPATFVNPSRNVLIGNNRTWYYPIANSASLDICEDIPKKDTEDPLNICLLASGDVRNVLYTTYRRRKLDDQRKINFYVNDQNPAIIARNVLLLRLAVETPLDRSQTEIDEHVDLFLSLWADLAISEAHKRKLDALLTQHLEKFTETGECFMTVPQQCHLWQIKKAWAVWLTTQSQESLQSVQACRAEAYQRAFNVELPEGKRMSKSEADALSFTMEGISYAMDFISSPQTMLELRHYLEHGTMSRGKAVKRNFLNPTLRDPESKQLPQSTSNPFITYHSTVEPADFAPAKSHSLYRALHRTVKRLLTTFAQEASKGRVFVQFDVGDCNAFLATRLESCVKFDAIDTSNMFDYLGPTSLLLMTAPRINKKEPNSTIWMETIKCQLIYGSTAEILENTLWISYSILPSVLQIKGELPFESCLDFDQELGRKQRKTYLTGVKFKWSPILSEAEQSCRIDLLPKESTCVFRQMIDKMLETLCAKYHKRVIEFKGNYGFYAHPLLYTVPALMTSLLSAAQRLKTPQTLFDYLYKKVKSEPRFQTLRFDVQNIATQMYPDDWQPKEPLHSSFAHTEVSSRLSQYVTPLMKTSYTKFLSCPVIGGVLVSSFSQNECIEVMAPDTAWMMMMMAAKMQNGETIQTNLEKWLHRNVKKVQFIDSFVISSSYEELDIFLPTSLVYPGSPYVLLLFDLTIFQLMFAPLELSNFKMRLTKEHESNLLSLLSVNPEPTFEVAEDGSNGLELVQLQESHNQFEILLSSSLTLSSTFTVNVTAGKDPCRIIMESDPEKKPQSLPIVLPNYGHKQGKVVSKSIAANRSIRIIITKPKDALRIRKQLLNLDSLQKWPNKPFDPKGMFTPAEVTEHSLMRRDNYYCNVRRVLSAMFIAFTDVTLRRRGIVKFREDDCKLFHAIRSPSKEILGYSPGMLTSPRGVPIIEFWYLYTNGAASAEAKQLTAHMKQKPNISNKVTDQEADFLQKQLAKNAKRLQNRTRKTIAGASLERSFFIPLYPAELKISLSTV